jgi:hypothetical protein
LPFALKKCIVRSIDGLKMGEINYPGLIMMVEHDSVLASANYICSLSEHVTCKEESISVVAEKISSCISSNERTLWRDHPLNPKTVDQRAANW